MKNSIASRITLCLVGIGTVCIVFISCSSDELNPRQLSNALAEELTDVLEFDNQTIVQGAPPASAADGPRLDTFTAPLVIGAEEKLLNGTQVGYEYEQVFDVLLNSYDTATNLEHVAGAIAFIKQANKDDQASRYIKISPPESWVDAGGVHVMRLVARVHRSAQRQKLVKMLKQTLAPGDVAVAGNSFHVGLALFSRLPDGTEKVGNYLVWNLVTYPAQDGNNSINMCACKSRFTNNAIQSTNVELLGDCQTYYHQALQTRPSEYSPSSLWSNFVSGQNTNRDDLILDAADPNYAEHTTIRYPVGTRFYQQENESCLMELSSCPSDEIGCRTPSDCPKATQECCQGLCRDLSISDTHCGSCTNVCPNGETCQNSTCCPPGGCQTNEVVLASWTFEYVGMAVSMSPTSSVAEVRGSDFTSADGQPFGNEITGSAPSNYFVTEDDWSQAGQYLSCSLTSNTGYRFELTRIEFDHSVEQVQSAQGWELRHAEDDFQSVFASGLIDSALPSFITENVDLTSLVHGPGFVEFQWHTSGGWEPGIAWGLDNVRIYGRVTTP